MSKTLETIEIESNNIIAAMLNAARYLTELDNSIARDGLQGTVKDLPVRFIRRPRGWSFVIDVQIEVGLPEGTRWMNAYTNIEVVSDALKNAWEYACSRARDRDFNLSMRFDKRRSEVLLNVIDALGV